ncbi:MAG: prepilin-type N-terminal cleavage/methylation domain-containing protein [Acidobacteriota bacterium]
MNATRLRREAGVTLVELLIASVLLALILLAIAPLFIGSVRSNYAANEYTSINNLARDRLEQLMSIPIPEPDPLVFPGYQPQLDLNGGPAADGNYPNDLPTRLPDPLTEVISATSVRNPLVRTYTVTHWTSSEPVCLAPGCTPNPWILQQVTTVGNPYDFKKIDVTVSSVRPGGTGSLLGIGQRTAQVSGFLRNPDPAGNFR